MPRKIYTSVKTKHVLVLFLMLVCITCLPPVKATSPAWSYHIEGITALAMSKNGDYTIVGTQEGYFYVFDNMGNIIRSDNARSEITTVDITENGTFFVGTDMGYYLSTEGADPQIDVNRNVRFLSSSISDDGGFIVVGTEEQIYVFRDLELLKEQRLCIDRYNYMGSNEDCDEKEIMKTDISSSGNISIAATLDVISSYHGETGVWQNIIVFADITSLAISGNGQTIACGTGVGEIVVFDTESYDQVSFSHQKEESINDIKITDDGKYIIYGASDGTVTYSGIDGSALWIEQPMNSVTSLSISNDGSLIAVIGEKLCLLNGSGRVLQEISFPEPLRIGFLSKDGRYLSCVSDSNISFFELYDNTFRFTKEYKYPSRRSLPLRDILMRKEHNLDDIAPDHKGILLGDVNGDEKDELIIVSGNNIIVANKSGEKLSEIEFSNGPRLQGLLDVTGDFIPEIIVGHNDGRMAFKVYDGNGNLLTSHEFYTRWELQPEDGCNIFPLVAADIDGDLKIEVICYIGPSLELRPRGIYVFEYPSFSEEWFYAYAPFVSTPTIIDLNGDGDLEVLLGSSAPCNGAVVRDTDDSHAYVAAIDSQGKELWIRDVGTNFRRVWIDVADLEGDGTVEVVCGGWSFEDTWGQLFVLNSDGEYIRGEDNVFDRSLFFGGVSDIDSDGKKEILSFTSEGDIMIFDYLLKTKQKKRIDVNMGKYTRALINDIDADGDKEIIIYSNDEKLYMLSSNLEIEWTESFPGFTGRRHAFISNIYGCKNDLVVISDRIHIYSHQNDVDMDLPCPLWAITKRNLTEEAAGYLDLAEPLFAAGEYRNSRTYYNHALAIFSQLEDQEMTDLISERRAEVSHLIFEQDVRAGTIGLGLCDSFLCISLLYYWATKKRWYRLGEGTLLLSLPVFLGLFQVYYSDADTQTYLKVFANYFVPSLVLAIVVFLRQSVLGFVRTILAIVGGHKDMLVLSIVRSDGSYKVSVESIEEKFNPIKESRKIVFSLKAKKDVTEKIDFMLGVLSQYSSATVKRSLPHVNSILREAGAEIYRNFIPDDFSDILSTKFLLLEVEDTEIPWELMHADEFFATKYAVSRRIVTTESVNARNPFKRRGRRALIISDPLENLPGAKTECEIVHKRLNRKMDVVFVEGCDANTQRIAHQFGQGFDIIHYAGHVDNGLVLSDGIMKPNDVKEFIIGAPVVVVNGCKSEDLARAFLLGGAVAYIGTIHAIHDESAARIAADFYDLCLQYQIGEALRRARKIHVGKSLAWASLIMYGDPTLKLL